MPYKTIGIISFIGSPLMTVIMFYDEISGFKFNKIGGLIIMAAIFFAGIFLVLSLTRIENKSFKLISCCLIAFACMYAVLRGVYIENHPINKVIFSAVLAPAFFALILNVISWFVNIRKE
jgi:hypothetical protein